MNKDGMKFLIQLVLLYIVRKYDMSREELARGIAGMCEEPK
jgi:hypothetical protein